MDVIHIILGALQWFGLTFSAAWIACRFMPDRWYRRLEKPIWTPPDWLFGPVWTMLYLLMATSAFLVWNKYGWSHAGGALSLFLLQLALNAAWTWIFFDRHQLGWAFYECVGLTVTLLATAHAFWRLEPLAGLLMIPYVAWVFFATLLTGTIWHLNGWSVTELTTATIEAPAQKSFPSADVQKVK